MRQRFLAVDVGGTDVKWGVASDGVLGDVRRLPTSRGTAGDLIRQLSGLHADAAEGEPLPWAVCLPGLVDTARGRVIRSTLGLEDEPIAARLAEAVTRPRLVVNDVFAAAVGEAAGETIALLQIGSGVAGRIVVDGAVVSGAHGYGGEVGHLVFVPGGRPCTCGLVGCVEAYAGMATIRKRYLELGRSAPAPSQVLADAAADAAVAEVLEDAFRALGFAAAVLVSAGDPGTLRLGGGLAAAWGEALRAAVEACVARSVPHELSSGTRLELSRLGERAPLLGLLRLAEVLPAPSPHTARNP